MENTNLLWNIITGSVPGTSHIARLINNQDAIKWYQDEKVLIAIVSDGCSASNEKNTPHYNEIGSHIIANICVKTIRSYINHYGIKSLNWDTIWDRITSDVLSQMKQIISTIDDDFGMIARTYFQTTVLGYIITPDTTIVFGCGDGVYGINGDIHIITPPNSENYPPYLIYSLINSSVYDFNDPAIRLHEITRLPTEKVQTIFVGTDGVSELLDAATKQIPGQETLVGSIDQLWINPLYQKNPFWLQTRLALYNTTKIKRDENQNMKTFPGLLSDDTSLILSVRKDDEQEIEQS